MAGFVAVRFFNVIDMLAEVDKLVHSFLVLGQVVFLLSRVTFLLPSSDQTLQVLVGTAEDPSYSLMTGVICHLHFQL